jgi:hypothetical protein
LRWFFQGFVLRFFSTSADAFIEKKVEEKCCLIQETYLDRVLAIQ